MQIILMRHGKPKLAPTRWLAPCDMGHWMAQYDQAGVHTDAIPPASLAIARLARVVITSPLHRSQSSARALGHPAPRVDALFSEAPLPQVRWACPRLPPFLWAALFRIGWLLGYARGVDPFALVSQRARAAGTELIRRAEEGPVLLIGHGIMNRLIARELKSAGWTAATGHRSGHWSAVSFQSP